jgi:hypothetical protein
MNEYNQHSFQQVLLPFGEPCVRQVVQHVPRLGGLQRDLHRALHPHVQDRQRRTFRKGKAKAPPQLLAHQSSGVSSVVEQSD